MVFIVALEEGLLPHTRARDDDRQLEEERRLLFVGITRAQRELYLSRCRIRTFRGQQQATFPSRFLEELPAEPMEFRDRSGIELSEPRGRSRLGLVAAEGRAPPAPAGEPARVPPDDGGRAGRERGRPAGATSADVDALRPGVTVIHPQFGIGRIVSVEGAGPKRKGTVAFAVGGPRTFVLALAPLRPLGPARPRPIRGPPEGGGPAPRLIPEETEREGHEHPAAGRQHRPRRDAPPGARRPGAGPGLGRGDRRARRGRRDHRPPPGGPPPHPGARPAAAPRRPSRVRLNLELAAEPGDGRAGPGGPPRPGHPRPGTARGADDRGRARRRGPARPDRRGRGPLPGRRDRGRALPRPRPRPDRGRALRLPARRDRAAHGTVRQRRRRRRPRPPSSPTCARPRPGSSPPAWSCTPATG